MRSVHHCLWLIAVIPATFPQTSQAQNLGSLEPRVNVGTTHSPSGSLLARTGPGRPWAVVEKGAKVSSRDLLLALPGGEATLQSSDGSAHLVLQGNLPQLSELPLLESGVVLHDSRAFDMDVTLDRGRIVLTNGKEKGSAKIWVRLPATAWDLTLGAPRDQVAIEVYGRWPRGTSFSKEANRGPTQAVVMTVLKGSLTLRVGQQAHLLKAPPGPASFYWDSTGGHDAGPRRLEKAPEWTTEKFHSSEGAKQARAIAAKLQASIVKQGLIPALGDLHGTADDEMQRTVAVASLGAIDDLSGLMRALTNEKSVASRSQAVVTLRHWIGHSRSQDIQLYQWLSTPGRFTPAQAETIMQLLHSPFDPDQPETYQTLLAYLRHRQLAIRELATWHLHRLVPKGRKIENTAAGSEAEQSASIEKWKSLLTEEKLLSNGKSGK